MIIAANHIPQRAQPLLDALDLDLVRNAVAQVLQLLVRRRRRHEQPLAVAGREAPDDARARDGRVADGDDVLQLGLEDRVEVLRRADGDERIAVGEGREDADSDWEKGCVSRGGVASSVEGLVPPARGACWGLGFLGVKETAGARRVASRSALFVCSFARSLACWLARSLSS